MTTSQNGWPTLPVGSSKLYQWVIPAHSGHLTIRLRNGSAGFLLVHFLLWWAEVLEPLAGKVRDDWGHAVRPIRGGVTPSNHESATAADANATRWPLGTDHMTRSMKAKIRLRLKLYRGCLRWGGDYKGRLDQMHTELNRDLPTCERMARLLMKTPRGRRILAANPGQKAVIMSGAPAETPVAVAALAGLYKTSASLLTAHVRSVAKAHPVILLTEVANPLRRKVLRFVGWDTLQATAPRWMGECAILVRRRNWQAEVWKTYKVGEDTGPGGPVVMILALLKHRKTGATLLVGTAHFESGNEGRWKTTQARVVAQKQSIANARQIVNQWTAKHRPDAVVFVPDWNLNLLRDWVRDDMADRWPELDPPTPANTPKNGDHPSTAAKRRLIVWPIGRGLRDFRAAVLAANPASDHRAVQALGTITKESR